MGKSGNFNMTLKDKQDKYLWLIHLTIELFYLHCVFSVFWVGIYWLGMSLSLINNLFQEHISVWINLFYIQLNCLCNKILPVLFVKVKYLCQTTHQFEWFRFFVHFLFGKSRLSQLVCIAFFTLFIWNFLVYFNLFCCSFTLLQLESIFQQINV